MQVTERDMKLICWINGLGLVSIQDVMAHLQMGMTTAYKRLRKLGEAGLLRHERYLHNQPGIYRATRQGVAFAEDTLSAAKRVRLGQLRHDLLVVKLSVALTKQYHCEFIPERRLRQARGIKGVGQGEHVSDGLLRLPDKTAAIEVELSLKGEARRLEILNGYLLEKEIQEVWYFCGSRVILKKMTEHQLYYPFLKCLLLSDYWSEQRESQP